MLVSIVEVLSCENPRCRKFGQIVEESRQSRFYYCPICGTVSKPRSVSAAIASSTERYRQHLREVVADPQTQTLPN